MRRELIRRSEVYLTNYLPPARNNLAIAIEHVRGVNPDIVDVGVAYGESIDAMSIAAGSRPRCTGGKPPLRLR
jgi:hypothetical protein